MFPFVLLVCSTAVFIGLLNSRGRFFLPALGAAMLNLVMIASVYWLTPWFGKTPEKQIFGLAIGYLLAGAVQAVFQIPALLKEGFRFVWVNPFRDPVVREVLRKMGPATIGAAAYQINVLTTSFFAGAVSEYAVASFAYATRLMELPQGIVGISLATYLLTELSGLAVDKKFPEFRRTLKEGLLHMVFVNALAMVLLVSLAQPMIRLLFQHGRFTEISTLRCTGALVFLAPGLLFFSANNILARAFYALNDTRTPMMISLFCLGTNLLLVFYFAAQWQQRGLALANTLSASINMCLLFYALKKALPKFARRDLLPGAGPMGAAACVAGGVAWGLNHLIETKLGVRTVTARAIGVFGPITAATLAYFGLSLWLKVPQAQEMLNSVWKGKRRARS
jgi:putative peptidoglycan lipid II flippase